MVYRAGWARATTTPARGAHAPESPPTLPSWMTPSLTQLPAIGEGPGFPAVRASAMIQSAHVELSGTFIT